MTREMIFFNLLALCLGAVLVAGLDGVANPQPAPPRSLCPVPEAALLELPLLHPVPVGFERRNPFAPPSTLTPVSTPVVEQPPAGPREGGLQILPPQSLPHPTAARHIHSFTPSEIPVALRGVLAVPGRAIEAQLTTQDGGQITVQIGTEIPVVARFGMADEFQPVKIVDISDGDVIVERDGRRISLRALLTKP